MISEYAGSEYIDIIPAVNLRVSKAQKSIRRLIFGSFGVEFCD